MHWAHPVPGFKMRNTSIMKPGHCDSGTPAWITLSHRQKHGSIRLLLDAHLDCRRSVLPSSNWSPCVKSMRINSAFVGTSVG